MDSTNLKQNLPRDLRLQQSSAISQRAENGVSSFALDRADVQKFIVGLFGAVGPAQFINVWDLQGKQSTWHESAEDAVAAVVARGTSKDVYVGLAVSGRAKGVNERVTQNDAAGLVGLWADLDVKGPTHDEGFPSVEDALAAVREMPIRPTFVNYSGTGIQAFWAFEEIWVPADRIELDRMKSYVRRFGALCDEVARRNGGRADPQTFDIARVMRVPGTVNQCKGKAQSPARILEYNPSFTYNPSDFEELLPPDPRLQAEVTAGDCPGDNGTTPDPAQASSIELARTCLRHLKPERADDYGQWLRIGMALRSVHPSLLADWVRFSAVSSKYQPGECEKKWASFGPRQNGVKIGSLVRWAREDGGEAFEVARLATKQEINAQIVQRSGDQGYAIPTDISNRLTPFAGEAHEAADEKASAKLVPLGTKDPVSGRLVLSPSRTLPTARAYLGEFHTFDGVRALHSYAGMLLSWEGNRYCEIEPQSIRQRLQTWLHSALYYVNNRETKQPELVPFLSNPGTVKAALDSIHDYTHLPVSITPPTWLNLKPTDRDPRNLLPFPTGTLDLVTGEVLPPTPRLFTVNAIEFIYDPHAAPPGQWIKFLQQLFGDDIQSIELLQKFMGYALVADTSQQKALLMVGPKRSGKGTIARVLSRLVGIGNVAGPTTSSLAGPFGLQPLLGKSLAIVSDARFSGDGIATVIERVLCITGEDVLTIDRKHMTSVTTRLPTRLIFISNELPRFNDASGALVGRFLMLRLSRSFYGQEDVGLAAKLMAELPGILLWAIEGLRRLRRRGHFVQPSSVKEMVQELEDLSSPVSAFVREKCILGSGYRIYVNDLFNAWQAWCQANGTSAASTKQSFGRDLATAFPKIVVRQNHTDGRFYEGIGLLKGGQ